MGEAGGSGSRTHEGGGQGQSDTGPRAKDAHLWKLEEAEGWLQPRPCTFVSDGSVSLTLAFSLPERHDNLCVLLHLPV